jgi:hypothetical protein
VSSHWLEARLADVASATSTPVVLVVDPHRLLPFERLEAIAETLVADGWWALRRAWELEGRTRGWDDGRLILHCRDGAARAGRLPFDIERHATVVSIDAPVPPAWRALFASMLPAEEADHAVAVAERSGDTRALLERVLGAAIPIGSDSGELAAVAALRTRSALPEAIWPLVRDVVRGELASALAHEPPDAHELVSRWRRWLTEGADDPVLRDAGPALLGLVTLGILPRVAGMSAAAPEWARFASADSDVVGRAEELLAVPPLSDMPESVADWAAVAMWLGTVRGLLSLEPAAPAELIARFVERTRAFDEPFERWLRTNYGPLLQSTASPPRTVSKILPFLARRLHESPRMLLVVLDGVGFAQWSVILETTGVRPLQQHACLAVLPTETAISRQALIAAELPDAFAASLATTAAEPNHWNNFWEGTGLARNQVRYHRVDGLREDTVVLDAAHRAVVVIVSAVDKLMHGSRLLDDVELTASVRAWCRQGFFVRLLADARAQGFETWVASDHGNVVADAGGAPTEGLRIEHAGTRYRLYRTAAVRDAAAELGVAWTPPRLPPDVSVLFAPARTGFHRVGRRVTHGGISFEEVFVPLARMA